MDTDSPPGQETWGSAVKNDPEGVVSKSRQEHALDSRQLRVYSLHGEPSVP